MCKALCRAHAWRNATVSACSTTAHAVQAIPIHSPDVSRRAFGATVHGRHQLERKRMHAIGKT
eukprot:6980682-Alexandrium_andersonii.AAC.1